MSEQTSPPEQSEQRLNAEMNARLDGLKLEPLLGRYARKVILDDASRVLKHLGNLKDGSWVFRGHARASWHLSTELERAVAGATDWHSAEVLVMEAFMKHAPLLAPDIPLPRAEDNLSWLALARHCGAPTRLLDCTKSPYIAALFAASGASRDAPCAIWALKSSSIAEEASRLLDLSLGCHGDAVRGSFIENFFRGTGPPVVAPVESPCPDKRQLAQQALFLCPNQTQWCVDFETSLKSVLQRPADPGERWVYKIKIRPQARDELLNELRKMRISYEDLFPGLDGFVRSLRTFVSVKSDDFDYFRRGFESITGMD